jgi:hypothetical protein
MQKVDVRRILTGFGAAFCALLSTTSIYFWKSTSILSLFPFFCLFFLNFKVVDLITRRKAVFCGCGAFLLGSAMSVGYGVQSGIGLSIILKILPGFILLFFSLLILLFTFADKFSQHEEKQQNPNKWILFWQSVLGPDSHGTWKLYVLLLVSWLPIYILCFPGIVTTDTMNQLGMWFGTKPFTTHHPPVYTAYLGLCLQLGRALFGNFAAGIAIASTLQSLALAVLLTATIKYMAKQSIHFGFRLFAFLFYALMPVMAWYAVTLWKDIWLAGFVLLFVLIVLDIIQKKQAFFRSRKRVILLIVCLLGVLVSKNTGVYILVLSLLVLIPALKGCRIPLTVSLVGVLLINGIITGPIYSAAGIEKGAIREMLSIPLMQITRVVAKDAESISMEDRELIADILPYDELSELYNKTLADPVKDVFNNEVFADNAAAYAELWVRLGFNSPMQYTWAFLEHSLGYWYPDIKYWTIGYNTYPTRIAAREESFGGQEPYVGLYSDPLVDERHYVYEKVGRLQSFPVLNALLSIGLYFWIILCCSIYLCYKKKKLWLLCMVPLVVVWLTCLASPVFSEFRYAWPAIICVPVIIGFVFGKKQKPTESLRK